MGFWCSLFVEIVGGIVTALVLGIGAAYYAAAQRVRNNDDRIDDLYEDNRRWFRDRDRRVEIEKGRALIEHNRQGLLYSGMLLQALARVQQNALHDYRDELSGKRRRYRELRHAEGKLDEFIRRLRAKPMRRFELTDAEKATLASWRANIKPAHWQTEDHPIDDPTSVELEPDLRRFEAEGDPG